MITAGVIYGLTDQDVTEDLRYCLGDWPIAARELYHAFKLFENFDERSTIAGGRLVMRAIEDIKLGVKDCGNSGDDWVAFGLWFENLNPEFLVQRITMNTVHEAKHVTKVVLQGRHHWKAEEYFKFGESVAELAIIETKPLDEEVADLDFLQ